MICSISAYRQPKSLEKKSTTPATSSGLSLMRLMSFLCCGLLKIKSSKTRSVVNYLFEEDCYQYAKTSNNNTNKIQVCQGTKELSKGSCEKQKMFDPGISEKVKNLKNLPIECFKILVHKSITFPFQRGLGIERPIMAESFFFGVLPSKSALDLSKSPRVPPLHGPEFDPYSCEDIINFIFNDVDNYTFKLAQLSELLCKDCIYGFDKNYLLDFIQYKFNLNPSNFYYCLVCDVIGWGNLHSRCEKKLLTVIANDKTTPIDEFVHKKIAHRIEDINTIINSQRAQTQDSIRKLGITGESEEIKIEKLNCIYRTYEKNQSLTKFKDHINKIYKNPITSPIGSCYEKIIHHQESKKVLELIKKQMSSYDVDASFDFLCSRFSFVFPWIGKFKEKQEERKDYRTYKFRLFAFNSNKQSISTSESVLNIQIGIDSSSSNPRDHQGSRILQPEEYKLEMRKTKSFSFFNGVVEVKDAVNDIFIKSFTNELLIFRPFECFHQNQKVISSSLVDAPWCITCNLQGNLFFVTDKIHSKLSVFCFETHTYDILDNFRTPTGITSYRDSIIVCDTENQLIKRYEVTDIGFRKTNSFGSKGVGYGQFITPCGIASNPKNGLVAISDIANGRIQVFRYYEHLVLVKEKDIEVGKRYKTDKHGKKYTVVLKEEFLKSYNILNKEKPTVLRGIIFNKDSDLIAVDQTHNCIYSINDPFLCLPEEELSPPNKKREVIYQNQIPIMSDLTSYTRANHSNELKRFRGKVQFVRVEPLLYNHDGTFDEEGLKRPQAIALDNYGNYFVVKGRKTHTIEVLDQTFKHLYKINKKEEDIESNPYIFGLCINPTDYLYITDSKGRIMKY